MPHTSAHTYKLMHTYEHTYVHLYMHKLTLTHMHSLRSRNMDTYLGTILTVKGPSRGGNAELAYATFLCNPSTRKDVLKQVCVYLSCLCFCL